MLLTIFDGVTHYKPDTHWVAALDKWLWVCEMKASLAPNLLMHLKVNDTKPYAEP